MADRGGPTAIEAADAADDTATLERDSAAETLLTSPGSGETVSGTLLGAAITSDKEEEADEDEEA